MKKFEIPEIEVSAFDVADVITTSTEETIPEPDCPNATDWA